MSFSPFIDVDFDVELIREDEKDRTDSNLSSPFWSFFGLLGWNFGYKSLRDLPVPVVLSKTWSNPKARETQTIPDQKFRISFINLFLWLETSKKKGLRSLLGILNRKILTGSYLETRKKKDIFKLIWWAKSRAFQQNHLLLDKIVIIQRKTGILELEYRNFCGLDVTHHSNVKVLRTILGARHQQHC